MKNLKKIWLAAAALLAFGLAFGLRTYSAFHMNIDHDETTYLIAANKYTNFIRSGQFNWLAWETANYEHPALSKIVYGAALLTQAPLEKVQQSDLIDGEPVKQQQAVEYVTAGRMVSTGFGSLTVLILSILNPLAGFFLAVNTLAIKYTSEFYLEALPMFTSLLCVVAYGMFYKYMTSSPAKSKKAWLWLAFSAVCLGATAASKYVYCVAGLAIAVHWLVAVIAKKLPARTLLVLFGWGILSFAMFFLFNPYLWVHTAERLMKTLTYHMNFQASAHVVSAHYPWWQPINWLFAPFAGYSPLHDPYSYDAILFSIDSLIFVLAVIGLPRLAKRQPVFLLWIVIGLVMLFFWGSKWAQYPLILLAPWCYSAAQGVSTIIDLVKKALPKRNRTA